MVQKKNTTKNRDLRRNSTKKNKYYGGELGPVTGTNRPSYKSAMEENKNKGMKTFDALKEAMESSGYNEWKKLNYPYPKTKVGPNFTKEDVPPEAQSTSVAPEAQPTSVAPEAQPTSVAPEITIPSIVDQDLFNKALASNVDVLIEKSLDMNDFSYVLEQQAQQKKQAQQQGQLQAQQQGQLQPQQPGLTNLFNNSAQPILAKGGSKYLATVWGREPVALRWSTMFNKYKTLIDIFSSNGKDDDRRNTEINRFSLFLEMMSFYHDVEEEFIRIKSINKSVIDTLKEEYHNAFQNKENENESDFIDKFSKITDSKKERLDNYFVSFVLFNSSINKLFSDGPIIIPPRGPLPVKVNIFQLSEQSTGSVIDINRRLTSDLPGIAMGMKSVNKERFYTQFETFDWSLDFINENFFESTRRTGDNMSVLVRSTILYVISQIFNNEQVKQQINGASEGRSFKNSADFKTILSGAFGNISQVFLSVVARSFLPNDFSSSDWTDQITKIENFITASAAKRGGIALPYNIFLNLFKRENDEAYITNIPDNIINTEALAFVNDLETFLTFNTYLSEATIQQIKQIQRDKQNITNTVNLFDTKNVSTNNTVSVNINCIGVSQHVNPNPLTEQITDFGASINKLKIGKIEANIKNKSLTVHSNPFDFKANLTASENTFSGTNIPENCKFTNRITDLDDTTKAAIDCQRACLMSQLVYENTKVVRMFEFKDCWGGIETLTADGKGLKYLGPYQPDYQYGAYTNDITENSNKIERFNNAPYIKNAGTDNLHLTKYNYVEHKCHVWVDDNTKRVYVVFRGSVSTHDWLYTDLAIAQGLGFQEGRLLQIKEILRDIYRQLNIYLGAEQKAKRAAEGRGETLPDPRAAYKLIFAGHSLGGFLSIMAAAVVFNNKVFNYKNTFQTATSITFNPWFPPEGPKIGLLYNPATVSQGVLDYYVPIINYGTTCALAFGICGDAAERTIIPCCSNKTNLPSYCTAFKLGGNYIDSIKGPFYYYLVNSWASSNILNIASRHSVHNFFGKEIQMKLLDAATNCSSLYNDSPENINKKYDYMDKLFNTLNTDAYERRCSWRPLAAPEPALVCGIKILTNIVLSGKYNLPLESQPAEELRELATITDKGKSIEITVDPAKIREKNGLGGGKKYKTNKKTSKKIRKTRSKRTTKKLRK